MENTGYALGFMPEPYSYIKNIINAAFKMGAESKHEDDSGAEIRGALDKVCLLPYSDIPRVYDELSLGEWPEQLGQKPKEWDETDWIKRSEIVKPALESIKNVFGAKMLERHRYTARLGMTDSQFEDWWECVGRKMHEESDDKKSSFPDMWWIMMLMMIFSRPRS